MRWTAVATDYDELRSDVKESQESSLAPDAHSAVRELDETDDLEEGQGPGGEFIDEELIVEVVPQADDEFICSSCFLVHHRSQLARQKDGARYCADCDG